MRVLLFGAGEFGVPTFKHLHETHQIVALVSQPDRPAGRKRKLTPAPAAQWAQETGIDVLKSDDVNTPEFVSQIEQRKPDVAVVIAFGQKLSPELINAAGKLTVNLHSSLLPKYRGAAPINWAVINGEIQTGVSVIALAQKMDAGLIYAQAATPIDPLETAGELHDRLAALGPQAVAGVLDDLTHDRLKGIAQAPELATRAPKLSKADSIIDFTQDAQTLRNRIHGLTPWPGVSTFWHRQRDGQQLPAQPLFIRRVKVSGSQPASTSTKPGSVLGNGTIACGQGTLELLEVQLPGKRLMAFEEFTRGNPLQPGDYFDIE